MGIVQLKIVEKRFVLAGIDKFSKWDEFDQVMASSTKELADRINEIKNAVNPNVRINYFYSETGMQDGFNLMKCVEITDDNADLPKGFVIKKLANTQYAVFVGKEGTMGDYARKEWLPQSEYNENFEIMGDLEFINKNEAEAEFWLPIVKK